MQCCQDQLQDCAWAFVAAFWSLAFWMPLEMRATREARAYFTKAFLTAPLAFTTLALAFWTLACAFWTCPALGTLQAQS